uniref:Olfactory receptor n=1 Tax=Pyxicephalus adspersus TaxID=30357 RepID=A0AAV3A1M5_PYXAD|nr:TPA: hypothetical protein GDO54_017350 [Pyxicephalus adspersus]
MNQSLTFFLLRGISNIPHLQVPIFLMVLFIYLVTLFGNMTIVLLIFLDHRLHTPMYFFIRNLSFLDICYSTDILSEVLLTFIMGSHQIPKPLCMLQLYGFMSFVGTEVLLLTAMSYDRYVAICNPLRYTIVMNSDVYISLVIICWLVGFMETLPHISTFASFSCFKTNVINHFFCDLRALMDISCSNTFVLKTVIMYESIFSGFLPFLLTFMSYIYIIRAIFAIPSGLGRYKAFYTCASHLMVVMLFYVTLFCLYLKPTSSSSSSQDSEKVSSLLYTAVVPMLNPLIYSLKNKDVKLALRRVFEAHKIIKI